MIRAPRVPRPSRPILLTILVTAMLAFPFGIALASHQFSDVPNTNPYHADIDALVDAGVTLGCGGGKYCPAANVTRDQMAAFMNRLGALAPGKTPVVNATKVDGLDSTAFHRYSASAPGLSTQYGAWAVTATSDLFAGETEVSFPVPFASAPNVEVVQFGSPATAQCAGSPAAPTAIAGYLCIYVGWNAEPLANPEPVSVYDPVDGGLGASRFGVVLYQWDDADANVTAEAAGTWAATAPLIIVLDAGSAEDDSTPGASR